MERLIILGSGPAGLAAAIYAGRANLSPLVIAGPALGGQVALTSEIENYPGFAQGIGGAELARTMQEQAERFGARVDFGEMVGVELSRDPFLVKTHSREYEARALIIATGVSPKRLGVSGEEALRARGISYCATCDGFFFKDRPMAVIGGGDAALKEAIFLTRFASKVSIIHRRDQMRAEMAVQEMAKRHPKIEFIWDSVVTEILGKEAVTGLHLRNVKSGKESTLPVEGVFIYIGNNPNAEIFRGQLNLDKDGYIITDSEQRTNIPGVFAAGDVQERVLRQVATAVGTGAKAAMEAEKYIAVLEDRVYPGDIDEG